MTAQEFVLGRDEAIGFDPRLDHVDAMIRVRDDEQLDLWSRHAIHSRRRPDGHRALAWRENSMGKWAQIGGTEDAPVCVGWFFAEVDGRVLCFYEVTSLADGGEMPEAWAQQFVKYPIDVARDDVDAVLQAGSLPCRKAEGYRKTVEVMREENRRKMEADIAEAERKRANRPPPLATADQIAGGIPSISDEELANRHAKLRPLARVGEDLRHMADPSCLRTIAFTWSPELVGEPVTDLQPAKTVITLHSFGYHGFFKPSIAEVLAQVPDDWADYVAYSLVGPSDVDDLNRDHEATHAGFHVATTTFYKRAS